MFYWRLKENVSVLCRGGISDEHEEFRLSFSQSMSVELHIKDNDLISTNFSNEKIRKRSLLTIDNYEDQSRYCLFKQTDFGNDSHSSIIQLKKKKLLSSVNSESE